MAALYYVEDDAVDLEEEDAIELEGNAVVDLEEEGMIELEGNAVLEWDVPDLEEENAIELEGNAVVDWDDDDLPAVPLIADPIQLPVITSTSDPYRMDNSEIVLEGHHAIQDNTITSTSADIETEEMGIVYINI